MVAWVALAGLLAAAEPSDWPVDQASLGELAFFEVTASGIDDAALERGVRHEDVVELVRSGLARGGVRASRPASPERGQGGVLDVAVVVVRSGEHVRIALRLEARQGPSAALDGIELPPVWDSTRFVDAAASNEEGFQAALGHEVERFCTDYQRERKSFLSTKADERARSDRPPAKSRPQPQGPKQPQAPK